MSSDEDNNPKEDTEHSEHKRTSNDRTSHNTNNKSRKSLKKQRNKPQKTLTKHKTNKSKAKKNKGKGTQKKDGRSAGKIPAAEDKSMSKKSRQKHPPYNTMVVEAIVASAEGTNRILGASRATIANWIKKKN
eukprot:42331_1